MLFDGEEITTLAFLVIMQYPSVTDGQTEEHRCSGYTSACIACYSTALVKILSCHKFLAYSLRSSIMLQKQLLYIHTFIHHSGRHKEK